MSTCSPEGTSLIGEVLETVNGNSMYLEFINFPTPMFLNCDHSQIIIKFLHRDESLPYVLNTINHISSRINFIENKEKIRLRLIAENIDLTERNLVILRGLISSYFKVLPVGFSEFKRNLKIQPTHPYIEFIPKIVDIKVGDTNALFQITSAADVSINTYKYHIINLLLIYY